MNNQSAWGPHVRAAVVSVAAFAVTSLGLHVPPAMAQGQQTTLRPIALNNANPFGTGILGDVQRPTINDAGEVVFLSQNRGVILFDATGAFTQLAGKFENNTAPGAPNDTFSAFQEPTFNDLGQVAFKGALDAFSGEANVGNNTGIWGPNPSGQLDLLVREGFAAPGVAGATFTSDSSSSLGSSSFNRPVLNDSGRVAFVATMQVAGDVTSDNDQGLWGPNASGQLDLLAREGSPAPGVSNATFRNFFGNTVSLTDHNRVAFTAQLNITGESSPVESIWRGTGGGQIGMVARGGGVAPDTGGAVFNGFFNTTPVNNKGDLLVRGTLEHDGVHATDGNLAGLWQYDSSGQGTLLVREGDAATGAAGMEFGGDTAFGSFAMNSRGQVAFASDIRPEGLLFGGVESGVWGPNENGDLRLIAREGQVAPGTGGSVFDDSFYVLALNGAGDMMFSADLRTGLEGPVINDDNINGVWLWSAGLRDLVKVVQMGDVIDVDPGPGEDLRTVQTYGGSALTNFSTGEDGRPRPLNAAGEFVVEVEFTDSSEGIFVASALGPFHNPLFASDFADGDDVENDLGFTIQDNEDNDTSVAVIADPNDSENFVLQLFDGGTDGDDVVSITRMLEPSTRLAVEFDYRFLTPGKLEVIIAGEVRDTILAPGDIPMPESAFYQNSFAVPENVTDFELRLSNVGDPEILLDNLSLSTVPEPTTLMLLAPAAGMMLMRRRRA